MIRSLIACFTAFVSGQILWAQIQPLSELVKLYDYAVAVPLDVREVRTEERDGARVHDITYASPKGGRVPAFFACWIRSRLTGFQSRPQTAEE